MFRHLARTAATVSLLAATSSAQSCSNTLSPDYKAPVTADGWSYRLIATGLTKPRGILIDDKGALLLVDRGVGIVHMELEDNGGTCLSEKKTTTLVDSPDLNHGIAISEDGQTLYASTSDKVFSWSYDSEAVTVSDSNRTLVTNMENSDHTTRTLLLSKKVPGILVVSRGSDSNEDPDAEDIDSGHSQIRAFDIGSLGEGDDPYNFIDGTVLGWGLRNSVGVAEEPGTGGIWSVENSVDDVRRNGIDVHQNNPGEELNFHGYLNGSTEHQGGNYGYPSCYAIWSTENFPNLDDLTTGDQFPTSESNVLDDETCASDFEAPTLTFQAHTAPLDIKFTDDGSFAIISFHGSWNRDDPIGYTLASVAFENGFPVEPSDSTTAAKNILSNADLGDCPDDCFRPVGLAFDKVSRLFMTSDTTGEIYVLQNDGSPGTGSSEGSESSSGDSSSSEDDNAATRTSTRSTGIGACLAAVVLSLALL